MLCVVAVEGSGLLFLVRTYSTRGLPCFRAVEGRLGSLSAPQKGALPLSGLC